MGRGVLRTAPARPVPDSFRGDIEGLRAIAVVLVVLDHLLARPAGGFVGVDVFFVISGFLITGLLLEETDRRGRLSFRGFYARRARRILPAALTVLGAVVVTAHLVFRGARVSQTVTDSQWALGFAANIHFARIGTDYFAAGRPPSLVQHFWSLAVEEQFYLVWPLLIVLVLTIGGRWLRPRPARLVLLGVVAAGSAVSFAVALAQTRDNPAAAYFASPDRAWELGAGALLAVASSALPRRVTVPPRIVGPLSLAGLAGIVVSAYVVPSSPGFPAPWAALPVVCTAIVIFAGSCGPVGRFGSPLTNPVSRYVGRISYSLYLWHWPVVLVVATLVPDSSLPRYAIAIAAMTGLSVASYHFVEAPLRRLGQSPSRRARFAGARRPALAVAACVAAIAVLSLLLPPRAVPSFTTAAAGRPLPPAGPEVAEPPAPLAHSIEKALSARHFPHFTPSLDQLGTARGHWGACDGATETTLAKCTFGNPSSGARRAVVIGDSIAMSWLPGVASALGDGNWRVYGLTLEACPAADVSVYDVHGTYNGACDQRHQWAVREANRLDPDLVILASTEATLGRLTDGATGEQASAEVSAGLRRTIERLHPSATRHVLTLSPPPKTPNLTACDVAGARPADCVASISNRWITFTAVEKAAADATHTTYRDTHLWFCNRAGFCPAFVGTMAVKWDAEHMTDVYARSISAEIKAAIDAALAA